MRVGIGLWCLQSSALRPRAFPAVYADLLTDAVLAEGAGLDSMWLSEHHFFYDGYCPALLTAAGAALAATTRLRIGTGVLLLPLQDPARVAAGAADLAAASGGRFDLGVGAGYRPIEYEGKGLEFAERLPRMRAGLDAIAAPGATGGAPVWVGVSSPAAARRAGRRGLALFLSGAFPPEVVATMIAAHRDGWSAAGSPGERPPRVGLLRNVWLADTPAERAQAVTWTRSSYVVYAGLGWTADDAGMDFEASIETSMDEVERGAVIGSVEQVAEHLRTFAELGVDEVVCRIGYDLPPDAARREQIERLGGELLPLVRPWGVGGVR